ncbi:MAG: hypothetical protein ACPGTS_01765 [Minisyncoccia bacterium]
MKNERLKKLENERDDHVTKIFWAGLEIALLFAIPLGIAIIIGLQLGGNGKWIALPFAFVISWILVIIRFKKLSAKMKKIDTEINDLRAELGVEKPTSNYTDEDTE